MSGKSIFIQAIGLFGTVLFFMSYQCKNNRTLFRVQFVSYLCYTTHLLMLGAITGGLSQRNAMNFESQQELLNVLRSRAKPGDVLLFKGSHGMHMENILKAFMEEET